MTDDTRDPGVPPVERTVPVLESSLQLITRARQGDSVAVDRLCARYLPRLRRWATGRMPRKSRGLLDTDDLVQNTLLRTVRRLGDFETSHPGAFQVYVRQVLINQIRDLGRRGARRPDEDELIEEIDDPGPSPLEAAIGSDMVERYEAALARLEPAAREAIVARVEMGWSYAQVAEVLGKPSADAARMTVARALSRLAEEMDV